MYWKTNGAKCYKYNSNVIRSYVVNNMEHEQHKIDRRNTLWKQFIDYKFVLISLLGFIIPNNNIFELINQYDVELCLFI